MRHQIEDVKQVNEELCAKVGELGQLNNELNNKIVTLTNKNQQLVLAATDLQKNLVTFEAKYNKLTVTERLLRKKFDELNESNELLQKQLHKEQEEKNALQKKLDDNIEKNSNYLTELNLASNLSKEYPSLKKKHDILQRRCTDYEQTMEASNLYNLFNIIRTLLTTKSMIILFFSGIGHSTSSCEIGNRKPQRTNGTYRCDLERR